MTFNFDLGEESRLLGSYALEKSLDQPWNYEEKKKELENIAQVVAFQN